MIKRICIHWTGGAHLQSPTDFDAYHYTCNVTGAIQPGRFTPEANISPLIGGYAQHCGDGNSNALGFAFCGMFNFHHGGDLGPYPLTIRQCESGWEFLARQCIDRNIDITPHTVYTHYEFGKRNPHSSSAGKIDIVHLPYMPHLEPDEVGDYIRGKVKWYKLKNS